MYHKVPIQKLSHAQILKLLKGERIRVKLGSGNEINASAEQHKKIMNAHKKGSGCCVQFDPYQIDQHQHMRGEGFKEGALRFLRKEVAPAAINFGAEQLKHVIAGEGIKKKARKTPVKKGKGLKEAGLRFLTKTVAPTVIDFGSEQLKKAVSGEGVRKKKPTGGSGDSCDGGALLPAGYGLMAAGSGLKKKRGRPSKKGGKGLKEDILNGLVKYGPEIAMTALPLLL
jgi:hypothetical protein